MKKREGGFFKSIWTTLIAPYTRGYCVGLSCWAFCYPDIRLPNQYRINNPHYPGFLHRDSDLVFPGYGLSHLWVL